jgi:hypothetical protein
MILLSDYSSQDRYFEFDPDAGAYSHIKLPVRRKDRAGYSGVAQLLHSPGEGKVLVAQYLWAGDAWFSIGAERWRLFDESFGCETYRHFVPLRALHTARRQVRQDISLSPTGLVHGDD